MNPEWYFFCSGRQNPGNNSELEMENMPFYEYECKNCGIFEKMQKFSDAPLTVCPTCGGEVHKLLSNSGVVFKGSGYYTTDYTKGKALARKINHERQKDNEAIIDGDVKGFNEQTDKTNAELTGL